MTGSRHVATCKGYIDMVSVRAGRMLKGGSRMRQLSVTVCLVIVLALFTLPLTPAGAHVGDGVCTDSKGNMRIVDPTTGTCTKMETPAHWPLGSRADSVGRARWLAMHTVRGGGRGDGRAAPPGRPSVQTARP